MMTAAMAEAGAWMMPPVGMTMGIRECHAVSAQAWTAMSWAAFALGTAISLCAAVMYVGWDIHAVRAALNGRRQCQEIEEYQSSHREGALTCQSGSGPCGRWRCRLENRHRRHSDLRFPNRWHAGREFFHRPPSCNPATGYAGSDDTRPDDATVLSAVAQDATVIARPTPKCGVAARSGAARHRADTGGCRLGAECHEDIVNHANERTGHEA